MLPAAECGNIRTKPSPESAKSCKFTGSPSSRTLPPSDCVHADQARSAVSSPASLGVLPADTPSGLNPGAPQTRGHTTTDPPGEATAAAYGCAARRRAPAYTAAHACSLPPRRSSKFVPLSLSRGWDGRARPPPGGREGRPAAAPRGSRRRVCIRTNAPGGNAEPTNQTAQSRESERPRVGLGGSPSLLLRRRTSHRQAAAASSPREAVGEVGSCTDGGGRYLVNADLRCMLADAAGSPQSRTSLSSAARCRTPARRCRTRR